MLRRSVLQAMDENDHPLARRLSRRLCSSPFRWRSDFRRRIEVLERFGKSGVVERYAAFLGRAGSRRNAEHYEIGLRLWACAKYSEAQAILDRIPEEKRNEAVSVLEEMCRNWPKREAMLAALDRRDYSDALQDLRALCRGSSVQLMDRKRRVDVMHHLGKSAAVERYAAFLRRAGAKGEGRAEDIARGLWACGAFSDAIEQTPDKPSAGMVRIALLCLLAKRSIPDAQDFLARFGHRVENDASADSIREVAAAAAAAGLDLPLGQDATPVFVRHWLAQLAGTTAAHYEARKGSVLVYSHSLSIGGAERQALNLVEELCATADVEQVTLLLKKVDTPAGFEFRTGSDKLSRYQLGKFDANALSFNGREEVAAQIRQLSRPLAIPHLPHLIRAIQEIRPEVLHVRAGMHALGALAGLLAGTPRVVIHFGSMTRGRQSRNSEAAILTEKLDENIIAQCAAFPQVVLAANSRIAAEDWVAECNLPPGRVGVIYNVVDFGEIGIDPSVARSVATRPPFVVGGVFRLAIVKDPLRWVEVARRVADAVPQVRFLIVGDGPMRPDMERAIAAAGLTEQFELAGFVTQGLRDYLMRMDVFLMTSLTESLPNAVIEAQLAGLPVIAPDVGGIVEAVADADTARITTRDVDDLAREVIAALKDTAWRRQVADRAPSIVFDRFSSAAYVRAVRQAYGWRDGDGL